ncbi:MAG: DUF167 domain-containing protein [Pseudanabaena sp. CoA8_M7]|nr:DUF167 domain-containing protein [Pseudanabaena mucicola]MCE2976010.1 DUF167 domain-containing protein [Pseudanabaena sp. CoA8_M7]
MTVHLKSPTVDGKANKELVELLAKKFGVPKSHISIQMGMSSRHKLLNTESNL